MRRSELGDGIFLETDFYASDQPAEVHCTSCEDDFCQVCYDSQHRKGNRKRHATTPLPANQKKKHKREPSRSVVEPLLENGNGTVSPGNVQPSFRPYMLNIGDRG